MKFRKFFAGIILMVLSSTNGVSQTASSKLFLEIIPANEISNALEMAPDREGHPPETPDGIPHQQHNQNAPVAMQRALWNAASNLQGIDFEPTPFSLAGSIGWRLKESFAKGTDGAFIRQSLEFGHQHVPSDGSMHLLLPLKYAETALKKGWGVIHPFSDSISGNNSEYVMIFGPRDESELKTIWIIAQISYYQARSISMNPKS